MLQCRAQSQVRVGADRILEEFFHLLRGKKIGIVTNHTALRSDGKHLVDALCESNEFSIVALFSPEHGIRGERAAGEAVQTEVNGKTGIPIYSLYGQTKKPTDEMLKEIDLLLFDMQDVGARFYTYISTMTYVLEAAAEKNIPVIICDRPNPLGGILVDGFVLEESQKSFVGLLPVPIVHGMTVGELALMIKGEKWIQRSEKLSVSVIPMEGWKRSYRFADTGLKWIKPSPNMTTLHTALAYPGTCLFEATNLSEGRGTETPFLTIGSPFIDHYRWKELLDEKKLEGVKFNAVTFTPKDISNTALNPKHKDLECRGVTIEITDPEVFNPLLTGLSLLATAKKVSADQFRWISASIDRLAGTNRLREMIEANYDPMAIVQSWKEEVERFKRIRSQYLLY